MTIKERIHTALNGGMPDQIPFTVYSGSAHLGDDLDDLINPLSPPSAPVQRRLQGPPAKNNFLAVGPQALKDDLTS
jgi:hypothetical protein